MQMSLGHDSNEEKINKYTEEKNINTLKYVEHGEIKNEQESTLKKNCPDVHRGGLSLSRNHTRIPDL